MVDDNQFLVRDGIIEIPLSGEKLSQSTTNLDTINRYGAQLYKANKDFIKEKVADTWFAVIEPTNGKFVASDHPIKLYNYTSEKYPGKLVYVIGLLRDNPVNFVLNYA
ncbi:MAG: hypothetical protein AAB505_02475 [Patescibacteria group bacterium]